MKMLFHSLSYFICKYATRYLYLMLSRIKRVKLEQRRTVQLHCRFIRLVPIKHFMWNCNSETAHHLLSCPNKCYNDFRKSMNSCYVQQHTLTPKKSLHTFLILAKVNITICSYGLRMKLRDEKFFVDMTSWYSATWQNWPYRHFPLFRFFLQATFSRKTH